MQDRFKFRVWDKDAKEIELEKKLYIAVKALSDIEDGYSEATGAGQTVRQALKEIDLVGTSVSLAKEEV